MEFSKSSSKREAYNNTILPQETGKISNKHLTLHLKQLEKNNKKKNKTKPKLAEGKKS